MKQRFQHIILLIILALAWSGEAWGQNSSIKTISEDVTMNVSAGNNLVEIRNNNMKCETTISKTFYVTGTKATVTFNMPNAQKSSDNIELDGNSSYTISWAVSSNFTLKMTSFGLTGRSAATSPTMKITGGGKNTGNVSVYGTAGNWKDVTLSGISISGATGSVTLNTNKSSLAIFYIHSFSFKYTLYHDELDLQYLDAAISAANALKTSLTNNSTLNKYVTDAISNANRSSFLFPTYIDNNNSNNTKTPTDVDNATNKLNAVTTFVSKLITASAYEESKVPNAVYTLLHAHDDVKPNEQTTTNLNTWSDELQSAIEMANATTSDYQAALTTIATAKTNSANNNPANIASSDISTAETALEAATSTQAISNALANIKFFDTITFKSEIPKTIYTGESVSNVATAESSRTLTYTSSNTTALSVNGTTLNALEPGNVTITATTGSTGDGYYECKKTQVFTVLPVFYFSATATSNNTDLGTATVSYQAEYKGTINDTYKSTTAVYTATPNTDCIFLGWYTSTDYSKDNLVSKELTYTETKKNEVYASTVYFSTLHALFKKKHNLQWVDDDMDLNLVLGTTGLSSAASVTSNKTIKYESLNTGVLTIDSNGALTTVATGQSTIWATVAGDDIYQADTLSRVFNVGEKKQATFTPVWEGTKTTIEIGESTSIGLTNIATEEEGSFTVSIIPSGIISYNRDSAKKITINAVSAGTAILTLTQTGNTYLVGSSRTDTIYVCKHPNTFALAKETKTLELEEVWEHVITDEGNGNPIDISCTPTGVATYSAANDGTITANAVGLTTFTFTQAPTADYEGTTKTLSLTVKKKTNTLSISPFALDMEVDGTITLEFEGKNSSAPIVASFPEAQHLSSKINNGSDVISYANGVITAKNAGTAKIKFTQAETDDYEGFESGVYEITVSKKNNAIAVTLGGEPKSSKNVARGDNITLGYSSDSDGAFHVALTTGSNSIATLSNNIITAGNTDGINVWTITQDETYNYKPATATVRIKVNTIAETEGYVYTGWTGADEEYDWSTISGTGALALNGPAEFFTFQAKATDIMWVWSSDYFYAQYSTDGGSNWTTALTINLPKKDQWYDFSCEIPENATHVRILTETGAVGNKQVRNVRVSRRTYVRANANTTDLGEIYTDETATTTFTIDYSSTNGGDLEIISNNSSFSVSPTFVEIPTVSNGCDNIGSPITITVTYTPNPDQLNDEATITVSDRYNSADLTFTAKAKKYSTTIKRGSNTETTTAVYGIIDNVFSFSGTSAAYPMASSSADFYYAISNTPSDVDVISYDPENNTITGQNGGTARLTIYQKATKLYSATNQTFDFTVTKLENNTYIYLSNSTLNVDGTATVELSDDNSKGEITVDFSNIIFDNFGQNREGRENEMLSYSEGVITGVNAGTCKVTVTQEETSKYLSKSVDFTVKVNKLKQTLTWDNPNLETGIQLHTTISGNTATSDVGLTPVTYSSGSSAITVDATTGALTANEVISGVTITASQAGNYKYKSATLSRVFSVFNKQVPVFDTDSHFNGLTGRIELTCTATITVTGVSTGEDFSVTYGNKEGEDPEPVISVSQSGETITITTLRLGNATLTLKQEGNDDFIAKTQTYNITVFWPNDFLTMSPTDVPTYTPGNFRKVFFNREFSAAGYYSLALPFSTTVATLTGRDANANDWVAQLETVTYSQADGYTLHFNKVSGGDITANQPYILHLGATVTNPTWTNVEVEVADETTVTATTGYGDNVGAAGIFSDWSMTSNFTPGMSMSGLYGVVNGAGALKKGGSSATLNAFTAYITPPTGSAGVKVQSAFTDEWGVTTYIKGLPDDGAESEACGDELYDLSGRRINSHQQPTRGIYVRGGRRVVVK